MNISEASRLWLEFVKEGREWCDFPGKKEIVSQLTEQGKHFVLLFPKQRKQPMLHGISLCLQTKCHLISKMQYVPLIRVGQMGGASILPDPTQPNPAQPSWPNGFLPYSATPLSGDHLPLTPISDHISYVHFCFLSVSMWYSLQNCPFFNFFCLSSWRKFDSLFPNFCKVYFPWMWQNLTFQLYSSILKTGYSGVISRC